MLASPGSLKMLIVDDDDVDRERVRRYLKKGQDVVEVVEAESGVEALRLLQADQFDCIVLDNHLGDTTGAELISRIHKDFRDDCPIIMVTGAGSENLAVQAMMDGAYDYLPKTQLSSDVLQRSVKRAVELHRTRRELAQIHESLEQRVDEQAATIRQSAKDLRALVDNAPTAMGYWDAAQQCRFGNVCLSKWFHVNFENLPGTHLCDLLGPVLYGHVREHIEEALHGHEQAFEQASLLEGVGPAQWLYWQLRPDMSSDGLCLGFYATLSDVTASRQVKDRVQELLHFSDAVIDNSPIGIAVFQSDGVCALSNQAFIETCGQRPNWQESALWSSIQSTLVNGESCRAEVSWSQAGNPNPVKLACSLARFDRAGSHHVLVIARDVTEQMQVHEALVSARDSAESAARAKSAFLANMSHEIRTPMNAIVGFSRLALEDELPHTARSYIEKMHTSALALMDILDDVLDYSKIEAGFMHLEQTCFVLEETLQRVADLFQARIEQKNLSFIVDLDPNVPRVLFGDPLRLSQVLTNLVGNAVKFTDHGHIQLKVHVATPKPTSSDHSLNLSFSVVDTGVGMAQEVQTGLFEAFIQGDSSITRRFGGTGLGLAICKRLVNLMGGQIGVKSVPGQGSEFGFTIQVSIADDAAQREFSSDVAGRRVLILDGNSLSRKAIARQLRSWHVASHGGVDIASGLAHLERLQRKGLAVDTLLVDYALVRADEAGSLEQLNERAAALLGGLPTVIYVTTQGERLEALSADIPGTPRSVLVKPVLASRLLEVLQGGGATPQGNGKLDAPSPHDARMQSERLRGMAEPLQGARILLVEDNELNQIVADEFLRRCGMHVTIMDDGVKAVDAVRAAGRGAFDAVLMDMHMPIMDGLEATRRIMALPGAKDLPIIGMTAAVLPEDRMRCRDAGMVDHIAKPVIPEHVIAVLLKWVAHSEGGEPKSPSLSPSLNHAMKPDEQRSASTNPSSGAPAFDLEALRERVHGNQDLVMRLLRVFVEQEAGAAAVMNDLLALGDSQGARRKAHDLKGSSANLGLMDFARACSVLQDALTHGAGVQAAMAVFVRAHAHCIRAVRRILAGEAN